MSDGERGLLAVVGHVAAVVDRATVVRPLVGRGVVVGLDDICVGVVACGVVGVGETLGLIGVALGGVGVLVTPRPRDAGAVRVFGVVVAPVTLRVTAVDLGRLRAVDLGVGHERAVGLDLAVGLDREHLNETAAGSSG